MNTISYITSLLTFYLKGEISAEPNFVKFKEPNTILGLIPLGAKTESVAVNQISTVKTNNKLKFGKLILGVIIALLSLSCFKDSFLFGLILLLVGINSLIDAFEVDLQIVMTSGQIKNIDFFIFEKQKAINAENMIMTLINNRMFDTNTREQTDRIVNAIERK